MDRLSKLYRLSGDERWLLLKATALLAFIRASLAVLPYPSVRPLLDRASRTSHRLARRPQPPDQLAWATRVAGRIVPHGGHCFSQALTLRIFLARRNYPSTICFGVQQGDNSPLMAHAWVEHDGEVLIGGDNLHRFRRLAAPESLP